MSKISNNLTTQNILGEIVKELCNLYNEERTKGKDPKLVIEVLDQFLAEKKQNSDDIIN
ncbi:4089_t:CDS:2, partial [Scutellospora calospora]